MCLNTAVVIVLPAMFYLVIYYILVVKLRTDREILIPASYTLIASLVDEFCVIMDYALVITWVVQICIGLGNKPHQMALTYRLIAVWYALTMAFTTVTLIAIMQRSADDMLVR